MLVFPKGPFTLFSSTCSQIILRRTMASTTYCSLPKFHVHSSPLYSAPEPHTQLPTGWVCQTLLQGHETNLPNRMNSHLSPCYRQIPKPGPVLYWKLGNRAPSHISQAPRFILNPSPFILPKRSLYSVAPISNFHPSFNFSNWVHFYLTTPENIGWVLAENGQ